VLGLAPKPDAYSKRRTTSARTTTAAKAAGPGWVPLAHRSHPNDVELDAEDPVGNTVWYHVREGGFMVLHRDDRGGLNNTIVVQGKNAQVECTPCR
jgi:hypothetical protein